MTLRHRVHVVQPHVKAAAIPGARKAAAAIVVTAATPEIEGMSQQPMGNMSIYSLYIYTWEPKSQFLFFPSFGVDTFFVITGVLVRLKARSEEPKYGLLTNAREVEKTFGILLGFYQYFFGIFLANCRVKCVFGQLWPKVNQIDMFFPSNATYVLSRWNRHIPPVDDFFSHCGKKHAKGPGIIYSCVYVYIYIFIYSVIVSLHRNVYCVRILCM